MRAAQRLAMASDKVTAAAIDASEFPELSRQHRVRGVPKSVFNDRVELLGAAGEDVFLAKTLEAAAETTAG